MGLRSIASLVAALCAFSATTVRSAASEPFEMDVRLRVDPSITSRRVTGRMKQEAEAIWQPYGVRLEWKDAGSSEPASNGVGVEASLEREFERRRWVEWPAVLGRTVVRPDPPNGGPIRVSFDATESVLALRTNVRSTMKGIVLDHELATALGRVLAHEIGQVLLGAPYHDQAGLMRARFRPEELAEPARTPFRLTCIGVGRLRGRLRVLTGHAQLMPEQLSIPIAVEDPIGTTREFPADGASCITSQPIR
jgi:hypothetical protein